MVYGPGVIVGQPDGLRPVRAKRGSCQYQDELGVGKGTIRSRAPSCRDGRMVVLVANHQRAGGAAKRLHCILKPLHGSPCRTDVEFHLRDIAVASGHLGHVAARDAPEILCPLVHDLGTRRDHYHTVDLAPLHQRPGNCR